MSIFIVTCIRLKTVSASALCNASKAVACERILSEDGLKAWWFGNIRILHRDPTWPEQGTSMSWTSGGGTFKAEVSENNSPDSVVMKVKTPSAVSTITHVFKTVGEQTEYTKIIEAESLGFWGAVFKPLQLTMLRSWVKKEVARAAAFANA